MTNSKLLFSLILLFTCLEITAQQVIYLKTVEEARALSAKTTNLFAEGKIQECIAELEKYWPLPANELASLESQTIKSLNVINERFGKYEGFVKLKESKIGDFAVRETYIIKYQYNALTIMHTYYRNKSGWLLNGFSWDADYTAEFE